LAFDAAAEARIHMFSPCMSLEQTGTSPQGSGCLSPIVSNPRFNHIVGIIIILNGILICVDADFVAKNPGSELPTAFLVNETVFFVIFLVELLLRIQVFRLEFFIGEEWRWNWFDTIVVITAAAEEMMKLIQLLGSKGKVTAEGLSIVKLMRIMKLTRAVRIVRVFKTFRELRIMVTSIVSTLRTLFWSVLCTLMIMAGFAVYLVTVVSDYQAEAGSKEWARQFFGSMPTGMLSLFQASTGGVDWREISSPLWNASPPACIAFLGYISMMAYAIVFVGQKYVLY